MAREELATGRCVLVLAESILQPLERCDIAVHVLAVEQGAHQFAQVAQALEPLADLVALGFRQALEVAAGIERLAMQFLQL